MPTLFLVLAMTLAPIDQVSDDTATLSADLNETISVSGGSSSIQVRLEQCQVLSVDGPYTHYDCSRWVESEWKTPVMMPFLVYAYGQQSEYWCRVARIRTATKLAVLASPVFQGIGFWNNEANAMRVVPKDRLHEAGRATLKSGEPAAIHDFLGYAGCWRGDASSSSQHVMRWKAFAAFATGAAQYRNWESAAGDHGLGMFATAWNRNAELLAPGR